MAPPDDRVVRQLAYFYNTPVAAPTNAGTYQVTATLNNANYTASSISTTLTIAPATPVFSGLTAPTSVSAGTSAVTFSGSIAANGVFPAGGEDVAITLNGVTQDAAIGTGGAFTSTFDISTLAASATPYAVTYAYGGDSNFNSASDSTTTILTINAAGQAPVIIVNPLSQTITPRLFSLNNVIFSAEASGYYPKVQWQVSTDNGNTFTNIAGATIGEDLPINPGASLSTATTSSSYTTSATAADNHYQFRAVFTNAYGSTDTTAAVLTLSGTQSGAPVVTLDPVSQTIAPGNNVTLTAAATGTPTPTVQWQVATYFFGFYTNFTNIAGATSPTYSFNATTGGNLNEYRAVFTNSAGSANTTAAVITVANPNSNAPVVTLNPVSQAVNAGTQVTLTAAATGTPAPTVQWQSQLIVLGFNTGIWVNIAGATATTYSFTATSANSGNVYRAVFANSAGTADTTTATLTIAIPPVVTLNPLSQSFSGTSSNPASSVILTAAATGSPSPTAVWQGSLTGAANSFVNLPAADYTTSINPFSGAVQTTLTLPQSAGYLYVQAVFINSGGSATTSIATLTVASPPVVTGNPINQSATVGQTLTFTAAASGVPTPTVQWQVSSDGGQSYARIFGATSDTYSLTARASMNGNLYQAVFTNSAGSATTSAATLTLTGAPVVTQNPTNPSVAAGTRVTLTAAATGTPAPSVQWQVNTGLSWNNIRGATSTSYSFTATSGANGYEYRAVFTNAVGSATTMAATITIITPPVITQNPSNATYALPVTSFGGSPEPTVSVVATATGTPTPTVVWQGSATGAANSFVDLPTSDSTLNQIDELNGIAQSTLTLAQSSGIYYVRAVFTNTYGTVTSTVAHLAPAAPARPIINTGPISQTVGAGGTVNLLATAEAYPDIQSVQWQVSTNGGRSWSNISGANSDSYSFTATASENGYQYRAVFTNAVGSTNTTAATLTVAQINVTENPTATRHNGVNGYVAVATGVPNAPTAVWQVSSDGGATWTNISAGAIVNSTRGDQLTTFVPVSAIPGGDLFKVVFTETYGGLP